MKPTAWHSSRSERQARPSAQLTGQGCSAQHTSAAHSPPCWPPSTEEQSLTELSPTKHHGTGLHGNWGNHEELQTVLLLDPRTAAPRDAPAAATSKSAGKRLMRSEWR